MKVIVCNVGIDMYCKCGFVDKVYDLFGSMRCEKSIIIWNIMIMGFGMYGYGGEVIKFLEEMGIVGVCFDLISYFVVLCVCNYAGLVEEGF